MTDLAEPPLPILDLPSVASRLPQRPNGQRPRIDRVQGRDQLYRVWVARAIKLRAGTGWFRTTWLQTAAALGYELSGDRRADESRYTRRIWNRAEDLRDARLVDFRPAVAASGQIEALEVRILPGELEDERGRVVDIMRGPGRGAWGRRRSHRFCPPRCVPGRRRGAIERPLFFLRQEVARPLQTPAGPSGRAGDLGRARAHARGAGPRRSAGESGRAALSAEERRELRTVWRTLRWDPGELAWHPAAVLLDELAQRAKAGDPAALDLAFSLIFGRAPLPPRRRSRRRLGRALARCDRYCCDDRGEHGAGVEVLLRMMCCHAGQEPGGVAFFVPALDRHSKAWRRRRKPLRRAARRPAAGNPRSR